MSELQPAVVTLANQIARRCYRNYTRSRRHSGMRMDEYKTLALSTAFLVWSQHQQPDTADAIIKEAARNLTLELTGPGSAYYEQRRLGQEIPCELSDNTHLTWDMRLDMTTLWSVLRKSLSTADALLLWRVYRRPESTAEVVRQLFPTTEASRARGAFYTRVSRAKARARAVVPSEYALLIGKVA